MKISIEEIKDLEQSVLKSIKTNFLKSDELVHIKGLFKKDKDNENILKSIDEIVSMFKKLKGEKLESFIEKIGANKRTYELKQSNLVEELETIKILYKSIQKKIEYAEEDEKEIESFTKLDINLTLDKYVERLYEIKDLFDKLNENIDSFLEELELTKVDIKKDKKVIGLLEETKSKLDITLSSKNKITFEYISLEVYQTMFKGQ